MIEEVFADTLAVKFDVREEGIIQRGKDSHFLKVVNYDSITGCVRPSVRDASATWAETSGAFLQTFLVACTRLYEPLCRSVGPSVRRSVGPSVRRSIADCSEHATYGDRPGSCNYVLKICSNAWAMWNNVCPTNYLTYAFLEVVKTGNAAIAFQKIP